MKWVKVLSSVFFVAMMLLAVNSCGVPSPSVPAVTAEPANGSAINPSDSIVMKFTSSMDPGALKLTGTLAAESDGGEWSKSSNTNDTLTIRPEGTWTEGSQTLIVEVVGVNGVPVSAPPLNYNIAISVPTVTVVPATTSENIAKIIGSDFIVVSFSAAMEPSTLVLTGDMVAESDGGTWSTASKTNDTLVIRPDSFWSGQTNTVIIDVNSAAGATLSTLTLKYNVDVKVPVATVSPADEAVMDDVTPVVISFNVSMNKATLKLTGTMAGQSDGGDWSTTNILNDTLTISPASVWAKGENTLIIDVNADNNIALETLALDYVIDVDLPTASVAPGTGSVINGGEQIAIDFNESMNIETLQLTSTLPASSYEATWSTVTNSNDRLTISPATSWPAGAISFTLGVFDLANHPLVSLDLNYTVDIIAPTITLSGADAISVELGTAYKDAGATALDNIDGDLTGSIVTVNPVDVNTLGIYTVTYNVSDAVGNPASQVTRVVTVTEVADVTPPVITLSGDASISIELGTAYSDAGATALDNIDGDITGSIDTLNPVNVGVEGVYTITYNVSDIAGNPAAQVTRTVTVTAVADITPPVITIVGTDISIELGTAYLDAGATAVDNVDGIISANIDTVNTVNVDAVGVYTVTYNVSDAAGNPATPAIRTVTVTADVTLPVIALLGDAVINLELGTAYNDAGATAADNIDGDITGSIDTVSTVNVDAEGDYTVTYNVNDAAGNPAVQVTRTVTVTAVVDVIPPVVTLLGDNPFNIELGMVYIDPGATATDNIDSNIVITDAIIIDASAVNINAVGSYIVTFDAIDTAGNAADQVERTVKVKPNVNAT